MRWKRRGQEPEPPKESESSRVLFPEFDALVHQHLEFVWRLLRRFGLPPADADDVCQQVFMIAARKFDSVRGNERAFLYGTARRLAANSRRDRRRRPEVLDLLAAEPPSPAPLPDHLLELERTSALLDDMLERMPEELRRVLVLADIEEIAVPAIAQLEGIPTGTAASRLRRARACFDELLRRHAEQNPFKGGDP